MSIQPYCVNSPAYDAQLQKATKKKLDERQAKIKNYKKDKVVKTIQEEKIKLIYLRIADHQAIIARFDKNTRFNLPPDKIQTHLEHIHQLLNLWQLTHIAKSHPSYYLILKRITYIYFYFFIISANKADVESRISALYYEMNATFANLKKMKCAELLSNSHLNQLLKSMEQILEILPEETSLSCNVLIEDMKQTFAQNNMDLQNSGSEWNALKTRKFVTTRRKK